MEPKYITISQINNYIKLMFDKNIYLKKIWLKGEISNLKIHSTGHIYLTLKDDYSRLSAIMFKSSAANLLFKPEDGMNVLVEGRISVYPVGGSYQIYIDKMEQDGLGNLYLKYEELKKKLQSEGYFDQAHKRPIPKYPEKIGIVTAPTGAAIKDILSTIKRRYPICETILFPALVQGVGAAPSIVKQIEMANNYDIDVLIIGRGGGSIEDLWAFNEEIVAKAIYNSKVPIISAVGHEVDFTISDYVSDLRAPTPTGAAEMAVPTILEVKNILKTYEIKTSNAMINKLDNLKNRVKISKDNYILKNPTVLYDIKLQKLDSIIENLHNSYQKLIEKKEFLLKKYQEHYIILNPDTIILNKQNSLKYIIQTLKLLNPLNILDNGYSLVKKDGKIIKDASNVKVKDELEILLSKGSLNVIVKECKNER